MKKPKEGTVTRTYRCSPKTGFVITSIFHPIIDLDDDEEIVIEGDRYRVVKIENEELADEEG